MKNRLFVIFVGIVFFATIFAKNIDNTSNNPVSVQVGDDSPTLVRLPGNSNQDQNREEIDLITDDFEGDISGWGVSAGWQLTEDSYNSATHSFRSPDELFFDDDGNPSYKSWDLFSPTYTLPLLGDGESMHFGF